MKLLFDQNLSPKLAGSFSDKFNDTMHIQDLGLDVAEVKDSENGILTIY